MRIRVITLGQRVKVVTKGRLNGQVGKVTRLFLMADSVHVGHYATVRFTHKYGVRNLPQHWLEVAQ